MKVVRVQQWQSTDKKKKEIDFSKHAPRKEKEARDDERGEAGMVHRCKSSGAAQAASQSCMAGQQLGSMTVQGAAIGGHCEWVGRQTFFESLRP